MRRSILSVAALCAFILFASTGTPADPVALPDGWKVIQGKGVTIQFPPEMKSAAQALLPRLQTFTLGKNAKPGPVREAILHDVAQLKEHRDAVLARIATALALDAPSPVAAKVFDTMIVAIEKAVGALPDSRRVRLYPREWLEEAIRAERTVPGFTRNGDGTALAYETPGVSYDAAERRICGSLSFEVTAGPDAGTPKVRGEGVASGIAPGFWPLALPIGGDSQARADAAAILDRWEESLRMLAGVTGSVIHEATESTLVFGVNGQSMALPYDRWFAEGLANWVAYDCLRQFAGAASQEAFARGFSREFQRISPETLADVKLPSWLFSGWEPALPPNMVTPYYVRATEAVSDLVRKHGPDAIPSVVKAWRSGTPGAFDSLAKAIETATGSPVADLVGGTPPPAAIVTTATIATGCGVPNANGQWKLVTDAASITTDRLAQGGLGITFQVLCFKPGSRITVTLFGPGEQDKQAAIESQEVEVKVGEQMVAVIFPPGNQPFRRGLYRFELKADNRPCAPIEVSVA